MKKSLFISAAVIIATAGCNSNTANQSAETDQPTTTEEAALAKQAHDFVDLGLPSGLKWATCNVGAQSEHEYGSYFAFGETATKDTFAAETYKWKDGVESICTPPNPEAINPFGVLKTEYDAATANWGNDWRMPTVEEQRELLAGCDWTWMEDYNQTGVSGYLGKSKANGNTIFLASGMLLDFSLNPDKKIRGNDGYYLSSSYVDPQNKDSYTHSCGLFFSKRCMRATSNFYFSHDGFLIRAVKNTAGEGIPANCKAELTVSGQINGHNYVDLGLPSGKKWATGNVGAKKISESGDFTAKLTKWGESWTVPAEADFKELEEGCVWTWVDNLYGTGAAGRLGTSKKNGNTVFLVAGGVTDGDDIHEEGCMGYYSVKGGENAYFFDFNGKSGFDPGEGLMRAVTK